MNNYMIYSFELLICFTVFYIVYYLFLRKSTHFKFNRWYLIVTTLIALIIPKLNFTYHINNNDFAYNNILTDISKYQQSFNAKIYSLASDKKQKAAYSEISIHNKSTSKLVKEKNQIHSTQNIEKANVSLNTFTAKPIIDINTILLLIYFTGLILLLLRLMLNILQIIKYSVQGKIERINGSKIIWVHTDISPFSFLNYIYISTKIKSSEELPNIILHERIHATQKHSFDIILMEFILILQWFNPFVWLYKRALKQNHEFLADQGVINKGIKIPEYQYALLNHLLLSRKFELVSNYSYNDLKQRIYMLTRKRSPQLNKIKYVLLLPAILLLCLAFSIEISIPVVNNKKSNEKKNILSYVVSTINSEITKKQESKNIQVQQVNIATVQEINKEFKAENNSCSQEEPEEMVTEGINFNLLTSLNGITYVQNDSTPYTGQCYSYYESGEKGVTGSFVNGKESGRWIFWYKNGQKKMEYTAVDGEKSGLYTSWYKNGKLRIDARYNMGEIDELYKCWHENGVLKKESCFNNGVPFESAVYDEEGNPEILL